MAERKQFKLPDVGEGLTEADIVTWRVKPGDQVTVNQVIVEIETAKSLVELPSPYDGVVTSLLVAEGQSVDVGTPIIEVSVGADASGVRSPEEAEAGQGSQAPEDLVPPPPADAAGPEAGAHEAGSEPGIEGTLKPKPERQAVLVGYGVKLGSTTRRPRKGRPGPAGDAGPPGAPAPAAEQPPQMPGGDAGRAPAADNGRAGTVTTDRPAAKPPVRKLAKDLGVDLAALTGTGPAGTITREDVQAAAGQATGDQAAAARPARR